MSKPQHGVAAARGPHRTKAERGRVVGNVRRVEHLLEAACRSLSLAPGGEEQIASIIRQFAAIAIGGQDKAGTAPAAFTRVGRAATERELRNLAGTADRLREILENLHEPTINALAAVGFACELRIGLRDSVRKVSEICARADVGGVPLFAAPGRPRDLRAAAVGWIAGDAYLKLTGKRPTYTTHENSTRRGEWPDFLAAVFAALGLRDSRDRLVVAVARDMRLRG